MGVDRLSLSFPVRACDERPEAWSRAVEERLPDGGSRRTFSTPVDIGTGTSVFLSIQEVPESSVARWWGKVEGNPSRVMDPKGHGLASVDDLPEVVQVFAMAAERLTEPGRPVPDWNLKRLDVARDFAEVEDPGRLIRGLGPVYRPWSRLNLVHADSSRNRAQTLMVGSKAGTVRLYDKHAESKGAAPPGTVRWEAENRKAWCQQYGDMKLVKDMSRESIGQLAANRWEWSQMGVEVASTVGRLVRATRGRELSERERCMFTGWLMCQAGGYPVEGLSRTTEAKFRRIQRQIGIAAPVDLAAEVEVVTRLDWESGREVLRVA